jgi:hypothetical protein
MGLRAVGGARLRVGWWRIGGLTSVRGLRHCVRRCRVPRVGSSRTASSCRSRGSAKVRPTPQRLEHR